jgi:hypothetical protein
MLSIYFSLINLVVFLMLSLSSMQEDLYCVSQDESHQAHVRFYVELHAHFYPGYLYPYPDDCAKRQW